MSIEEIQQDTPAEDEEFIEVDWEPIQAAIDAMAEAGLDLENHESVRDHLAVLLASLLRRIESMEGSDEEEIAELAAETAALATQIALGDEEVPELLRSSEEV